MVGDGYSRREALIVIGGVLGAAALGGSGALASEGRTAAPEGPAGLDIIGELGTYTARHEDTLVDLARRFGLGFTELVAANHDVDVWLPGEGTDILLPTAHILPDAPRRGIVLNLADQRLYYFPGDGSVITHPVGIGREGRSTPTGRTTVVRKAKHPTWYPPPSIRAERPWLPAAVPPGPDNPLGTRAFYFDWPAYLMHGTNRPRSVGRRVSYGCVRLYNENVETLYEQVPVGTPVTVVDQEAKVGWAGDRLMLDVHPSQAQADELEETGSFRPAVVPDLTDRLVAATRERKADIDWDAADKAAHERAGVPVAIGYAVERTEPAVSG